jgi:predicted DNA-binding protein (MmcQ/YjbR family)
MAVTLEKLATELRAAALTYPETYEEQPWGDRVVKVRGKIFFFCGVHEKMLYATVKVPKSGRELLERPYAEPTHYGMGKHGWVTLKFADVKKVPVEEIRAWMDESFRAIAPAKLVESRASSVERPKPKMKAKSKATLVCDDKLRAARAVKAFGERGVKLDVIDTVGEVKLGKMKAIVVDIGRNPIDGLAFAQKVDASDHAVHLFVAGVRDADQARKLRALGSAESFRAPPGDAEVADAVAAALVKRGEKRAP